jgi:hypothetical protein
MACDIVTNIGEVGGMRAEVSRRAAWFLLAAGVVLGAGARAAQAVPISTSVFDLSPQRREVLKINGYGHVGTSTDSTLFPTFAPRTFTADQIVTISHEKVVPSASTAGQMSNIALNIGGSGDALSVTDLMQLGAHALSGDAVILEVEVDGFLRENALLEAALAIPTPGEHDLYQIEVALGSAPAVFYTAASFPAGGVVLPAGESVRLILDAEMHGPAGSSALSVSNRTSSFTLTPIAPAPEPAAIGLIAAGAVAAAAGARRRRRA